MCSDHLRSTYILVRPDSGSALAGLIMGLQRLVLMWCGPRPRTITAIMSDGFLLVRISFSQMSMWVGLPVPHAAWLWKTASNSIVYQRLSGVTLPSVLSPLTQIKGALCPLNTTNGFLGLVMLHSCGQVMVPEAFNVGFSSASHKPRCFLFVLHMRDGTCWMPQASSFLETSSHPLSLLRSNDLQYNFQRAVRL